MVVTSQESYHRDAFLLGFTYNPFSKSIPNSDAIMPSNRAGSYDHNGTTFNSVPILEAEIRNLPVLCLHTFSQQPLRVQICIIGRSKGIFKANPTAWVTKHGTEYSPRKSAITGWTSL